MECVTTVEVKNNKVILPCGKKLKLYRENQDGTITFNPLFIQLNNKLQWTEQFSLSEPSCNEQQVKLPSFNLTRLRTTWFDKNGLANIVSIVPDGPYEVPFNNYWSAETIYNNLNYFYEWKSDKPTKVKFVSQLVGDKLLPLTTVDGELTVYEGTYGTFETWDYWNVSVCADPPTEVLFNISVRPATDASDVRLPYTDYLYFTYECEQYRFVVSEVIYSPESAFTGLVIVSDQLKMAKAKLKETLYILGCKLELIPVTTPVSNAPRLLNETFLSWELVEPKELLYNNGINTQHVIIAKSIRNLNPIPGRRELRMASPLSYPAISGESFFTGIPLAWGYGGEFNTLKTDEITIEITYLTTQPTDIAMRTEWGIFETANFFNRSNELTQGDGIIFDTLIVTDGPGNSRNVYAKVTLQISTASRITVGTLKTISPNREGGVSWTFQEIKVKLLAIYREFYRP